MDIFTISAVIAVSVFLIMCCCVIFIKAFGSGILSGMNITGVTVLTKGDDIPDILYNIVERAGSEFDYSGNKVILCDGGMDMGQREICLRFCDKYPFFVMCSPEKIASVIFTLQKD